MDIGKINLNQQYNIDFVNNQPQDTNPVILPETNELKQQDSQTAILGFLQSQVRPFENAVGVNAKVSDVEENGTEIQKSVVYHFDEDGDGIINAREAFNFNNSKIEKTSDYIRIIHPNGEVVTYENILEDKGEDYYKQGTIPVAVVDLFTGKGLGYGDHGLSVCNILKQHNPDIAITKFNVSQLKNYSPEQIAVSDYIVENKAWDFADEIYASSDSNNTNLTEYPDFIEFLEQYPDLKTKLKTTNDLRKFLEKNKSQDELGEYLNGIKEIKKAMDEGAEFKAVNLSSSFSISYEAINALCESEIGEKITPENIAKYKNQIKSVLYKNKDKEILEGRYSDVDKSDISHIVDMIDAIEDLKIPVYMAGAYRKDDGKTEAFNAYALANNAIYVESGVYVDGKLTTHPVCSPCSLSVNSKTGQKYIADSRVNDNGIIGCSSTSMSTPIVLAEALKD